MQLYGVKKTFLSSLALCGLSILAPSGWAWEPAKTVEFVVPAGTGGGADQMARLIQNIIGFSRGQRRKGRPA
jgi:tripartite-type tricarboxylate transporter receptor subunit TctC